MILADDLPHTHLIHSSLADHWLPMQRHRIVMLLSIMDLSHPMSKHQSLFVYCVQSLVLEEEEMRELVKRPTFFPQLVYDVIKEAVEDDKDMIAWYSTKALQERLSLTL